jgi:hypothetical protein
MLPQPMNAPPSPTPSAPIGNRGAPPVQSPAKQDDMPDKEEIRTKLTQLLTQARKLAEQNGLDFGEIVSSTSKSQSTSDVPRPPAPSVGAPSFGG